jgi:hypothetical protein
MEALVVRTAAASVPIYSFNYKNKHFSEDITRLSSAG